MCLERFGFTAPHMHLCWMDGAEHPEHKMDIFRAAIFVRDEDWQFRGVLLYQNLVMREKQLVDQIKMYASKMYFASKKLYM